MAQTAEEKAAAKAAKEAEKAAAEADSATVTWKGGSRTYSRAQHGEKFLEYAKEFAGKKNVTVA